MKNLKLPEWLKRKETGEGTGDEDGIMAPGEVPEKVLNLGFDSYFHESKSTRICGPCYICAGFLYKGINLIVYNTLALLIGIPMSIIWAILNALIMMLYVWILQPIIKNSVMCTYIFCPLCSICVTACCTPITDMCARIFRQIRIKVNLDSESKESAKVTEMI